MPPGQTPPGHLPPGLVTIPDNVSDMLATITPKYKKIENVTGVRKVEFQASIFSQTQASECSEQETFAENDKQTIK